MKRRIHEFLVLYRACAQDKARRASRHYSTGMAAYRCDECGAWHFGHHYSHKTPMPVMRRDHHIHSGPQRAGSF